jgi:hypothetical protein
MKEDESMAVLFNTALYCAVLKGKIRTPYVENEVMMCISLLHICLNFLFIILFTPIAPSGA